MTPGGSPESDSPSDDSSNKASTPSGVQADPQCNLEAKLAEELSDLDPSQSDGNTKASAIQVSICYIKHIQLYVLKSVETDMECLLEQPQGEGSCAQPCHCRGSFAPA